MTPSHAGRPRDSEIDKAILEAALELLIHEGYARMSVERVALKAGVGKPAIYLRHHDKKDLVSAALASLEPPLSPPESGDTRSDLIDYIRMLRAADAPFYRVSLVGTLIAEEPQNARLLSSFRGRVISPKWEQLAGILTRGKESGQVRADLCVAGAVDLLLGAYYGRHLAGDEFDPDWASRVVDSVWIRVASRP